MYAVETLASIAPDTAPKLDALVEASGWNQTARDWQLFERLGSIHVVRDDKGQVIATGAVLPMGAIAWISMILVAPDLRGKGLGRAVFAHCLQEAQRGGRTAMLDATPLGEPLYAGFGFAPLWRFTRWQREARPATQALLDKPSIDGLAALDAQALGVARQPVLADLLAREGSGCIRNGLGFGLVRMGRLAHYIGPLLAADERTAAALATSAARSLPGRVFIDVPDDRAHMADALRTAGFTPQRSLARMAHGESPAGHPAFIHAIAGPEFG